LRHAPRPKPPLALKDRLNAQVRLAETSRHVTEVLSRASGSWLRRWWPALVPGTVSLACAAVFALQQMEIRELKAKKQALAQNPVVATSAQPHESASAVVDAQPSAAEQNEIARLKVLADKLTTEISKLEQMRAENQKLRAQITAAAASRLSPAET